MSRYRTSNILDKSKSVSEIGRTVNNRLYECPPGHCTSEKRASADCSEERPNFSAALYDKFKKQHFQSSTTPGLQHLRTSLGSRHATAADQLGHNPSAKLGETWENEGHWTVSEEVATRWLESGTRAVVRSRLSKAAFCALRNAHGEIRPQRNEESFSSTRDRRNNKPRASLWKGSGSKEHRRRWAFGPRRYVTFQTRPTASKSHWCGIRHDGSTTSCRVQCGTRMCSKNIPGEKQDRLLRNAPSHHTTGRPVLLKLRRSVPSLCGTSSLGAHLPHRLQLWRRSVVEQLTKIDTTMEEECLWREAEDPSTGRKYYYHIETRETQWRKPVELSSPEERQASEEKERQQREFFAAMEANIMNSIATGSFNVAHQEEKEEVKMAKEISIPSLGGTERYSEESAAAASKSSRRAHMIRTISSMEDSLLVELVQRVPSSRSLVLNLKEEENGHKDIVFDPAASESASASRTLPRMEMMASNRGLSLLEATRRSNRSLLMEAKAANKSTLNVIDEAAALHGSGLNIEIKDLSEVSLEEQAEVKEEREGLTRELSFGTLIGSLPKEGAGSTRSLYGNSALDESNNSFKLTLEETEALEELAMVSEQMSQIGNESVSNFEMDTDFPTNGGMMYLQDIMEGGDNEEEEESEREVVHEDLTESDISGGEPVRNPLDSPPALVDYGAGTPAAQKNSQEEKPQRAVSSRQASLKKMTAKPAMERRNTCGTLYVSSTMSTPDTEATIKCICGVYRAHILQSEMEGENESIPEYRIFNDLESQQKPVVHRGFQPSMFVVRPPAPSLAEITKFYRDVFYTAKMETDCLIMSLIYIERLIKTTEGNLRPNSSNWRSLLFSCLVLSSKVWDDLSMWNVDFSETCPAGVEFSLQRINELEIAILSTLNYIVKVPASEYAKYYFLLRSMLIKSGLGGESLKATSPLDVDGAKRLQHLSSMYQHKANSKRDLLKATSTREFSNRDKTDATNAMKKLHLEHVVQL